MEKITVIISSLVSMAGVFWIIAKGRSEWHSGTLKKLKIPVKATTQSINNSTLTPETKRMKPLTRRVILGFALLNFIFNFYYLINLLMSPEPVNSSSVILIAFMTAYIFSIVQMFIYLNFVSKLTEIHLMENEIIKDQSEDIVKLADTVNAHTEILNDLVKLTKKS